MLTSILYYARGYSALLTCILIQIGKRDGQLLYPNRVAVVASSGDIVVTERSPTHQVGTVLLSLFIQMYCAGSDIQQVRPIREEVRRRCPSAPSRRRRGPMGQNRGRGVQGYEGCHLRHAGQGSGQVLLLKVIINSYDNFHAHDSAGISSSPMALP